MPSRVELLTFHRRLALLVAPLLFLQALTGMALLFKAELTRLTVPTPAERPDYMQAVPLSSLVSAAAQEPGYLLLPDSLRSRRRRINGGHATMHDGWIEVEKKPLEHLDVTDEVGPDEDLLSRGDSRTHQLDEANEFCGHLVVSVLHEQRTDCTTRRNR